MRAVHLILAALATCALPAVAATLDVQVDSATPSAGTPFTLDVGVIDGAPGHVELPNVPGLRIMPGRTSTVSYAFSNGVLTTTTSAKFQVMADQPGEFTLPPFDVDVGGGTVLRSQPLTVQVAPAEQPAAETAPADVSDSSAGSTPAPSLNPTTDNASSATGNGLSDAVPRDADGGPAKVFMLISPETTTAYVGQAVRVRIDFLIRMEVNAVQDSLPTIQGTNFLMNDFSVRGHEAMLFLENRQYEVDTFFSAITAPQAGDFPLASERDTYWLKSISPDSIDPFGFARTKNLAHGMITSNRLMMHILPVPTAGRPANFTGAIGQFQVTGQARPTRVEGGEPVTLSFAVTGTGNFDYVRCPVLGAVPEWKTYEPEAQTSFDDEEHTRGMKVFQQSVIARTSGDVPLPSATFAYFDPAARRYVEVPIALPTITVNGPLPASASSPLATGGIEAAGPPPAPDALYPNRTDLGALASEMTPVYRRAWFWTAQGLLASLPVLALLVVAVRQVNSARGPAMSNRGLLPTEAAALSAAQQSNDAPAFFRVARCAIQSRLGAQWRMKPEAITLAEIRQRDPALAARLDEFFTAADEVLYSAHRPATCDLTRWAGFVRELLALDSSR
jgi:hypothetical protein